MYMHSMNNWLEVFSGDQVLGGFSLLGITELCIISYTAAIGTTNTSADSECYSVI